MVESRCEISSQWVLLTRLLKEKGALAEVVSVREQRLISSANCSL